jgi:hypothetical protein
MEQNFPTSHPARPFGRGCGNRRGLALIALATAAAVLAARTGAWADANPARHDVREIEGWDVYVDHRLLEPEHAELGETALKLLQAKLLEISLAVPRVALIHLRDVPIWLDLNHGDLKQMQYHPSADWLKSKGYTEELARCVHIPTAAEFVDPKFDHIQPWAVLHELSHAYHDRVFGFDDPKILAAYDRFKSEPRYEHVLHIAGGKTEHYARTNQMEFFAELSEAYFGTNDFYPFVRAELKEDNPDAFAMLEEVWNAGEPKKAAQK